MLFRPFVIYVVLPFSIPLPYFPYISHRSSLPCLHCLSCLSYMSCLSSLYRLVLNNCTNHVATTTTTTNHEATTNSMYEKISQPGSALRKHPCLALNPFNSYGAKVFPSLVASQLLSEARPRGANGARARCAHARAARAAALQSFSRSARRLLEAWELVNLFGATQVFGKQVRRAHHCIFSM